jgi:Fuc2NAc and GlcNAc transferase
VLAVLALVWLTNLYNFMDGIDGLAAGEAVAVAAAGGALLWSSGEAGLASVAWTTGAASAGFLLWNWPPARIFMGDVGSGFLGFLFGALALASDRSGAAPAWLWLVLLGAFVGDATLTLARRAWYREPLALAHRKHAYQRLVQSGLSHRAATCSVLSLTLVLAILGSLALRRPAAAGAAGGVAVALVLLAYAAVERRRPMRRG